MRFIAGALYSSVRIRLWGERGHGRVGKPLTFLNQESSSPFRHLISAFSRFKNSSEMAFLERRKNHYQSLGLFLGEVTE